MTPGHEGAGTVTAVGSGVTAVTEGDDVAVHGPGGCEQGHKCAKSKENRCPRRRARHPPAGTRLTRRARVRRRATDRPHAGDINGRAVVLPHG